MQVDLFTAEQAAHRLLEESKHRSLNEGIEQVAADLTAIGETAGRHLEAQTGTADNYGWRFSKC